MTSFHPDGFWTNPVKLAEPIKKEEPKMEKVLVTKEQAGALEFLSNNSFQFNIDTYMNQNFDPKRHCVTKLGVENFAKALLIGWEIKKSPKEQIKDLYDMYKVDRDSKDYDRIYTGKVGCDAIRDTLNILGITIEEINDKEETQDED